MPLFRPDGTQVLYHFAVGFYKGVQGQFVSHLDCNYKLIVGFYLGTMLNARDYKLVKPENVELTSDFDYERLSEEGHWAHINTLKELHKPKRVLIGKARKRQKK